MGLRRLRGLEREAREEVLIIPQRNGSTRTFDKTTALAEAYLFLYDKALGREEQRSEFTRALEGATAEGRQAVEALLSSTCYSDLRDPAPDDPKADALEPAEDLSEQDTEH